ncbi:hypothetical protein RI367_002687 [Sorochytrium milnesiophthora]
MSWYDPVTRKFFGQTWKRTLGQLRIGESSSRGKEVYTSPSEDYIGVVKDGKLSLDLKNLVVHFYTYMDDPKVAIVVELYADVYGNQATSATLGWGLVFPLDRRRHGVNMNDIPDHTEPYPAVPHVASVELYSGSPRVLPLLPSEPTDTHQPLPHPLLTPVPACSLRLSCSYNPCIRLCTFLFPENIFVSTLDKVPGLEEQPEDGRAWMRMPSQSVWVDQARVHVYPNPAQFDDCVLATFVIAYHERFNLAFEWSHVASLSEMPPAAHLSAKVAERRLFVGLHNSQVFVTQPNNIALRPQSSAEDGVVTGYSINGDLELERFMRCDDDSMLVVLWIEYRCTLTPQLPTAADSRRGGAKSPNAQSKSPDRAAARDTFEQTFVVGWGAHTTRTIKHGTDRFVLRYQPNAIGNPIVLKRGAIVSTEIPMRIEFNVSESKPSVARADPSPRLVEKRVQRKSPQKRPSDTLGIPDEPTPVAIIQPEPQTPQQPVVEALNPATGAFEELPTGAPPDDTLVRRLGSLTSVTELASPPIVPVDPSVFVRRRSSQVDRSERARLLHAGFVTPLDDAGRRPRQVNPDETAQEPVNWELEMWDEYTVNEIVVCLKALSPLPDNGNKTPGVEMRWTLNPEQDYFRKLSPPTACVPRGALYLSTGVVLIDMYDNESLMHLGSACLPLRPVLRQGHPSASYDSVVDLVQHKCLVERVVSESVARLHFSLTNIGRKSQAQTALSALAKRFDVPETVPDFRSALYQSRAARTVIRVVAQQLLDNDRETRLLVNAQLPSPLAVDNDHARKLARMQRYLKTQTTFPVSQGELLAQHKENELQLIERARERRRPQAIRKALESHMTTTHAMHLELGSAGFCEFLLTNPYHYDTTLQISFDNPRLRVVTDTEEWAYLRRLNGFSPHSVPVDKACYTAGSSFEVLLNADEQLSVPFVYQSLDVPRLSGGGKPRGEWFGGAAGSLSTEPQSIVVTFSDQAKQQAVAFLRLEVLLYPPVLDRSYKFQVAENDVLRRTIQALVQPAVPYSSHQAPLRSPDRYAVRATEGEVLCAVESLREDVAEVTFKVRYRQAMGQQHFLLFLYSDPFGVNLYETWQVVPEAAFTLPASSIVEMTVAVTAKELGRQEFLIHVVDIERRKLLKGWIVHCQVDPPKYTKAFEVRLSVGKPSHKKISFRNPYQRRRRFTVTASNQQVLKIKDGEIELEAGAAQYIGLQFVAIAVPAKLNVLVFINDEEGRSEECLSIDVTCN